MQSLTNCQNCGYTVSIKAHTCPRCKADPNRNYEKCILCDTAVIDTNIITYLHTHCHDTYISSTAENKYFNCPACKEKIKYCDMPTVLPKTNAISRLDYTSNYKQSSCNNCGHPFFITLCYLCSGPVESSLSPEVWDGGNTRLTLHPKCAQLIDMWRRKNNKCPICGKDVEYRTLFEKISRSPFCVLHR